MTTPIITRVAEAIEAFDPRLAAESGGKAIAIAVLEAFAEGLAYDGDELKINGLRIGLCDGSCTILAGKYAYQRGPHLSEDDKARDKAALLNEARLILFELGRKEA